MAKVELSALQQQNVLVVAEILGSSVARQCLGISRGSCARAVQIYEKTIRTMLESMHSRLCASVMSLSDHTTAHSYLEERRDQFSPLVSNYFCIDQKYIVGLSGSSFGTGCPNPF